jgi:hypothetical protein
MELDARGGWPKNGLMAMDVNDPVNKHVRIATPDLMARVMMLDADRAGLVTEEAREMHTRASMRNQRDILDMLNKDFESHRQVSTMHFNRSVGSIMQGSRTFWNDPRSGKFDSIGENFGMQLMATMLGDQADASLPELISGIRDRSASFDTASELTAAMHVESAAAALEHRLHQMLTVANGASLGADKDGNAKSMLSDLANQWASTPGGRAYFSQNLPKGSFDGEKLTPSGLASAQFIVQEQLQSASAWLGETRESAKQMSSYKEFAKTLGTESRLAEIITFGWLQEHADDTEKAANMLRGEHEKTMEATARSEAGQMSGAELRERYGKDGQLTMGDLSRMKAEPSPEYKRSKSLIQNTLEYTNHFHPHEVPVIAHFLTGGQVDLTDGNVPTFNAATQSAAENHEYIALADNSNKQRRALSQAAKKAQDGGMPWTPQQGLQAKTEMESNQAEHARKLKQYRSLPRGPVRDAFRALGLIARDRINVFSDNLAGFGRAAESVYGATIGAVGEGVGAPAGAGQPDPNAGVPQ